MAPARQRSNQRNETTDFTDFHGLKKSSSAPPSRDNFQKETKSSRGWTPMGADGAYIFEQESSELFRQHIF